MTDQLQAINSQAKAENKQDEANYRLTLIDDIVRSKRTLWGFGYTEHDEFLSDAGAGQLFDYLYDLDILPLEIIVRDYERKINEHISKQIKF